MPCCRTIAIAVLFAGAMIMSIDKAPGATTRPRRGPLDPVGRIHIPIGIPDTLDALKTFVEAEGVFSPGCGSYGVYFWLFDVDAGRLVAPTMEGVVCRRGLPPEGYLIPWVSWAAGDITVTTRVCQVQRRSPAGDVMVVGAEARLVNTGAVARRAALYVVLRGLGPAGFAVKQMSASPEGDALLVDGRPAIVANRKPIAAGVLPSDTIGDLAMAGRMPADRQASSDSGDCSGAIRYDLTLASGESSTLGFVCPVLPGRRAVRHQWDGTSPWAQLDLAAPNPASGGVLQSEAGLDWYRTLKAEALFEEAADFWRRLAGRMTIDVPDRRWPQAMAAILGHVAMAMNEGAPDVAVVNYNVFNRDGVYVANILQKSGCFELAGAAIDYFLRQPFNGRVAVEADNPGQVLWAMGQHWLLSRDRDWLQRVYPAAAKLAAMIRYYRTTPPPHYVKADSLEFGESLPPDRPGDPPALRRQVLKPGSCDGHHPEYTEAFDIAGLRAAAALARAAGRADDAGAWEALAAELLEQYERKFGGRLAAGYGSCCVLWPCALYPYDAGKGRDAFARVGARGPNGWRYFPLAAAHQGLLAGNREAGFATIARHLAHEQCAGWYAFDEGGKSGPGGWRFYRTTWNPDVAMPHGWAVAELWLLMRDCLVFESGDRLVLLAGVDPAWLHAPEGVSVRNMPTYFGRLTFHWSAEGNGAHLRFDGATSPPGGFVVRLPTGKAVLREGEGRMAGSDLLLPPGTRSVRIAFE